jgi:peptide/nickel transport system permease protein
VGSYLLRRLGVSIITLAGITVIIFALMHAVYPLPGRDVMGPRASSAVVAAYNRDNGYTAPVAVQYWHYLDRWLHGNLGYSPSLNQSVAALFEQRYLRSLYLTGMAVLLALLIAIPAGLYQAARRNSTADHVVTGVALVAYSAPDFLVYLIAIQIFAFTFPIFGYQASQSTSLLSVMADWRDMTMPIVCFAFLIAAGLSRYMRSAAADVLRQEHLTAARARGLPERLVFLRHVLRNACLPMITMVGLLIPALLAGNFIVETVFNYNGLGLLSYNSVQNEDYPVLLALTLIGAVLTVLGNLLADIALTIADPRVRLNPADGRSPHSVPA